MVTGELISELRGRETDRLIENVKKWGRNKGIDNPDKQALKLGEEYGELLHELCRGRYQSDEVKDALGDIGIVWIILADILGYDAMECLSEAYSIVEKRRGRTVSGTFIKDE